MILRLQQKNNGMSPWPRTLANFPIILIAIVQQYVWATSIALDSSAVGTTAASVPALFLGRDWLVIVLFVTATLAVAGFHFPKKLWNVFALLPQQALLFMSAAGALEAVRISSFADGVERSRAFLLVDQCPAILIAFFHMWAIFLIMRYGED